jgi:ribosome-associated protein
VPALAAHEIEQLWRKWPTLADEKQGCHDNALKGIETQINLRSAGDGVPIRAWLRAAQCHRADWPEAIDDWTRNCALAKGSSALMRTTTSVATQKSSTSKSAKPRKTAKKVAALDAGSASSLAKSTAKPKSKKAPVELSPVEQIVKWLDNAKAEEIVPIDVRGKSSLADHMIVTSGRSDRHVGAIADQLAKELKAAGYPVYSVEGQPQCDWVVVDAGNVIVHIFRPEVRDFYNLEKMWMADRPVEASTH